MRYADIYADVESIAAISSTTALLHNAIKRAIRHALDRYAGAYPWPHYRERGFFPTVAPYTTGTVAVTAGSPTVTGTGTVFAASHVGMKFRSGSDIPWYDVLTQDSATQLTLAQNYQGTTASGNTYTLFQDEYRLNGDCLFLNNLIQTQFGLPMVVLNYLDMDNIDTMSRTSNDPILASVIGRKDDRYTTGTVTGALATPTTITGTNTLWTTPQGLSKGNRLSVTGNSEVYTIRSVDSATSLTIYEPISTAFTTSGYRIYQNNLRVKVKQYPANARNIYYGYQRTPFPLVNDYDEPDMPRDFHYMLVWAGLVVAWASKGNFAGSQDAEAKFQGFVTDQMELLTKTSADVRMVKNSMDRFWPLPLPPAYPPGYGLPLGLTY